MSLKHFFNHFFAKPQPKTFDYQDIKNLIPKNILEQINQTSTTDFIAAKGGGAKRVL